MTVAELNERSDNGAPREPWRYRCSRTKMGSGGCAPKSPAKLAWFRVAMQSISMTTQPEDRREGLGWRLHIVIDAQPMDLLGDKGMSGSVITLMRKLPEMARVQTDWRAMRGPGSFGSGDAICIALARYEYCQPSKGTDERVEPGRSSDDHASHQASATRTLNQQHVWTWTPRDARWNNATLLGTVGDAQGRV